MPYVGGFPQSERVALVNEDVFGSPPEIAQFVSSLRKARIVLCNPPFQNFTETEQAEYDISFAQKPAEVLSRVLENLPCEALLGFVLPDQALDGLGYLAIRKQIADRFDELEVVHLPEGVFHEARLPSILLLGKHPSRGQKCVQVTYSRVNSATSFLNAGIVDRSESSEKTQSEIESSLNVIELMDVWNYLSTYSRLDDSIDDMTRGVEWEDFDEDRDISEKPLVGFLPGFHRNEQTGVL